MGMSPKHKVHPKSEVKQTDLFGENNEIYVAKGPIFDKRYLRYPSKKYLIIVAILAVGIVGFFIFKGLSRHASVSLSRDQDQIISQTVVHGDSYTKLARQAMAKYLESKPKLSLSSPQQLFIETSLAQKYKSSPLRVGSNIEFQTADIEYLVFQSQNLTATQLQKWSNLAH